MGLHSFTILLLMDSPRFLSPPPPPPPPHASRMFFPPQQAGGSPFLSPFSFFCHSDMQPFAPCFLFEPPAATGFDCVLAKRPLPCPSHGPMHLFPLHGPAPSDLVEWGATRSTSPRRPPPPTDMGIFSFHPQLNLYATLPPRLRDTTDLENKVPPRAFFVPIPVVTPPF